MDTFQPMISCYRYDQLNRLKDAVYFDSLNTTTNSWVNISALTAYRDSFEYDADGNILTQMRHGSISQTNLDNLTYHYSSTKPNQLEYVEDDVSSGNYADDIDNQPVNNYDYDEIGNLIKDSSEGITNIEWTVSGKIKKITFSSKPDLAFEYTPDGHRAVKIVIPKSGTRFKTYTYYVRDAQGNVLNTYERTIDNISSVYMDTLKLTERGIYGSSRLGLYKEQVTMVKSSYTATLTSGELTGIEFETGPAISEPSFGELYVYQGYRRYELTNHLGNVLTVVSDKKMEVCSGDAVLYAKADAISVTDYTPFGAPMPGRTYQSSEYRFGFNGQERDDDVSGSGNTYTADFWEYDGRLGRRWNRDPKPFTGLSDYACFTNNPILFNDINGDVIGGDKQKAQNVKDAANNRISSLDKQISNLSAKIDERAAKGKDPTKGQLNSLEELLTQKSAFKNVIKEIDRLEQSSTVYNITTIGGNEGNTAYNPSTGAIDVNVSGTVSNTAHELKHAFQFETGKTSFLAGGATGNLHDINDEVEAYQRQALFDPASVAGSITPATVRNISMANGNRPYLNLPSANLTKQSTVQQVFEAVGSGSPPKGTGNMPYGNYAPPQLEIIKR